MTKIIQLIGALVGIVIGLVLSVLLAITCDLLIVLGQRTLTPWTRARSAA
jgi:osmoprotectant transport system permease protein